MMALVHRPACHVRPPAADRIHLATGAAFWLERPATLPAALAGGPGPTVSAAWIEPGGTRWWGLDASIRFAAGPEVLPLAVPDRCRDWLAAQQLPPELAMLARFFGGLAFDPAAPRAGGGPGDFPEAAFWLPACTVRAEGQDVAVLVAVPRDPGEPDDALRARLGREVAAWQQRLAAPAALASWQPGRRVAETGARERWEGRVAEAIAAIAAGRLEKVVLAHGLPLRFEAPPALAHAFEALAAAQPGTRRFLLRPGPDQAFLGATPELLFEQEGPTWRADCLAGTAPRDPDPERDAALGAALLASPKERHEHQVVVTFVTEALGRGALALSAPQVPELRRLANVQHLSTPVTAVHAEAMPLETALESLFPTPAVCGSPRPAARHWIADAEPLPRGWYAGAIGWVGVRQACLAVGIRAATVVGCTAWVHAGAGIVAGSRPEAEWAETLRKAAPLLAVLEGV